jgi:hypothetical protein
MNLRIIFALFFVFFVSAVLGKNATKGFDKAAFYAILKSGKIADVNEELDLLKSSEVSEKEAYEGTLLMRKAGLLKIPVERLKLFKKGRIKLETALLNDNNNGEYHFLRLVIQENAPPIAKYKADLENDKQALKRTYKNLSPAVQQAIIDYCKNSKILHAQDF